MAYVPPHLRGKNKGSSSSSSSSMNSGGNGRRDYNNRSRDFGGRFGGRDDNRRERDDRRGGGRSSAPRGGGNSRWKDFDAPTPARYGDRRGGRRGGSSGPWSGSTYPDKRLEAELYKDCGNKTGINFDKYDDIPVETSGENIPKEISLFADAGLPERLLENCKLAGFEKPTPVQKYSIPIGHANRDLMACAQTGSGKTGGFLFPIISQMLKKGPREIESRSEDTSYRRRKMYPAGLILAPTRELASQIYEEARKFVYCTGIAAAVVYGGARVGDQLRELERHGCDLLVATPGRLVDLIERGRISLEGISYLILDEADRMLDMGFEPQIRRIVQEENMPREGRQNFMFSATFPREIQRLAGDFMEDYIFLAVGRVGSAAKDIIQRCEYVDEQDKDDFILRFLSTLDEGQLTLIFVATKRTADFLEEQLCRSGLPATSIHGDRTQREREDALYDFKSGRRPVLVATDVASRGLDVPNVCYVINYDMSNTIDDYVHRIGRTGRAGNVGNAITLLNRKNKNIARDLYDLLSENEQEVPDWLEQMARGGYSRGGGSSRFGGRDYRRGNKKSSGGGGSSRNYGGKSRSYGGGGRSNFGGGSENSAW
eukprot:g3075.t1